MPSPSVLLPAGAVRSQWEAIPKVPPGLDPDYVAACQASLSSPQGACFTVDLPLPSGHSCA